MQNFEIPKGVVQISLGMGRRGLGIYKVEIIIFFNFKWYNIHSLIS